MSNLQIAFSVAAMIVLIIGAVIDPHKFNVMRCIALALAIVIAAQLSVFR